MAVGIGRDTQRAPNRASLTKQGANQHIYSHRFFVRMLATIFGFVLFFLIGSSAATEPKARNVLVLFSAVQYSESFLDQFEPALRARVPEPINFYQAYLDDPHVEQEPYRQSQAETFRQRYSGIKLDLVIANNPAAFQFAV